MANEELERLEDQREQLSKLPEALLAQFSQMAVMLPETESDGGASIIEQVLGAVDVQDLDAPWDAKDPDALLDKWIIVTEVTRSISDYADGLGVFLVITSVDDDSGEEFVWTSGSMGVVAQLVRAYTMDWLPCRCRLVKAERKTKSGYDTYHLEVSKQQPRRPVAQPA